MDAVVTFLVLEHVRIRQEDGKERENAKRTDG
jgi:hypothetical protein